MGLYTALARKLRSGKVLRVAALTVLLLLLLLPIRSLGPRRLSFRSRDKHDNATIPRIIHQIWDTYDIPASMAAWVATWPRLNPDFEYWFWSQRDVQDLLVDRYPQHLEMYNAYRENISRADAARYFIMHSFGGFYFDLDMTCLKPLEPWVSMFDCFLSEETDQHTYLVYRREDSVLMNGVLACGADHPFYARVVAALPTTALRYSGRPLSIAGPVFLTVMYNIYGTDTVRTLPSKYFLPTYDRSLAPTIRNMCRKSFEPVEGRQRARWERLCGSGETPGPEAFTNHNWTHTYTAEKTWKDKPTASIFEVCTQAKVYHRLRVGDQNSRYLSV